MTTLINEKNYQHGTIPKIGVLLVNVGTPDALTTKAIRRYLKTFLSDARVIELPKFIWWFILYGFILPFRPSKILKNYQKIWTKEGSPLRLILKRQQEALQNWFEKQGYQNVQVSAAMSYGGPSVDVALEAFRSAAVKKLIVLPLYPQYASSTTGSIFSRLCEKMKHWRYVPELHFLNGYADHPTYIELLATSVRNHWESAGRKAHLMITFHGIPERMHLLGDPYYCLCQKTGRLLAEALSLDPTEYSVVFQSRLGYASWLKPYCDQWLVELPKQGITAIDMIAPGFSADCLETLEELAIQNKTLFLRSGGVEAHYIPALNDASEHIYFLGALLKAHC